MKKSGKLQKGSVILVDDIWFIVVHVFWEEGAIHLCCICDNANNRYVHKPQDASMVLDPEQAFWLNSYGRFPEWMEDPPKRKIPIDIMFEALSGGLDERFNDWIHSRPHMITTKVEIK